MKKIFFYLLFNFSLSACLLPEPKLDPLKFVIQNNCTYSISVAFLNYDVESIVEYKAVMPNSTFEDELLLARNSSNKTYTDNEKNFFIYSKSKVNIKYPNGRKDIFTMQEFAAKADAQTGKEGRGSWTLTLCPDNENPPPPGEMIWPSPSSSY